MFARCDALSATLRELELDAFLGRSLYTNGYLAGFFEDAHERLLALCVFADGSVELVAPTLSANQARRVGITDVFSFDDTQDALGILIDRLRANGRNPKRVALDSDYPARHLLPMLDRVPGIHFIDGGDVIAALRSRKDAQELECMRAASRLVDDAFGEFKTKIRPGMTEVQVADLIQDSIRERGGKPTFCIVAFGPGSAEPHHINGQTELKASDVILLDFGCELNRYQSDVTRMLHMGPAPEKVVEIYNLVLQAHHAGRAAIRPGVTAGEVDAAARQVIESAGYGAQFFHRLGHGIGMEGHEEPNLVAGSQLALEVGNCFSVEPGIYLEGEFGVRIENLVTVVAEGHESFNAEPQTEIECIG